MKFIFYALLICFIPSCQKKLGQDSSGSEGVGVSGKAGNSKAIWQPSAGDSWVYQVVIETPHRAEISDLVEGEKIEKLESKVHVEAHQLTSVYQGLMPTKKDGPKAHTFHVFKGKQLMEIEYMVITDTIVSVLGAKQEGETPKGAILLSKPVPLVRSEWMGGETFALGDSEETMQSHFVRHKVIGWETVETEAGTFEALHIQVNGMSDTMEIKHSYWFSPEYGFIKQVKKYYRGDKTISTQTKVLEKMEKKVLKAAL